MCRPPVVALALTPLVEDDGRVVHNMYLVEVIKPSESTKPWDYYKIVSVIPPEQAFRPLDEEECPPVKK
jgi:branched-chain amino acid transport system substrate-binding protein